MDQFVERKILFDCLVCLNPSCQPRPVIDFGAAGSYPISVCGECLRKGDKIAVSDVAVRELISHIPPKAVEAKMKEVLAEYRQPQQGS